MRWNLLKTYDKIYTIDLHGNSKKKETAEDGSADQNVFDIMQGVSINLFIKTGKKKANELGRLFHYDLYGKRELKYDFLLDNSIHTIDYKELPNIAPNYFFTNKDFEEQKVYEEGFLINELFIINNVGIVTSNDSILINDNENELLKNVKEHYGIDIEKKFISRLTYRPFDDKYVYYNTKIIERAREKVMQHFTKGKNIGLVLGRQGQVVGSMPWNLSFITKNITDFNLYYRGGGMLFPLYLYPDNQQLQLGETPERVPNFNMEIVNRIKEDLNFAFVEDDYLVVDLAAGVNGALYPKSIMAYIYAILHSPAYREKYKEFLKIDFPRVPYPKDVKKFEALVDLGEQLMAIHLLESPVVEQYITEYPVDGNNIVDKIRASPNPSKGGAFVNVYINETQYFKDVPTSAWEFYIGGYQPAQKWLKDRKGKVLGFEDILHYQKIIVALKETGRIMKEIDEIEEVVK